MSGSKNPKPYKDSEHHIGKITKRCARTAAALAAQTANKQLKITGVSGSCSAAKAMMSTKAKQRRFLSEISRLYDAYILELRCTKKIREYCLPGADARLLRDLQMSVPEETDDRECQRRMNQQAESVLDTYGDAVLRLAYSYVHNMSDAEEILQDTLIRFLQAAPELESEEHTKAWLLRVAANLSKNRIRYNSVRQADELLENLAAEDQEDLSFVWEAVRALPDKYRAVIHLYYYEGYPTAQIAQILAAKETTVRSNLARGRRKLKKVLKEVYDFDQ